MLNETKIKDKTMLSKTKIFTKKNGINVYKLDDYKNEIVQDCECTKYSQTGCEECCGSLIVPYVEELTVTMFDEDGEIIDCADFDTLAECYDWIKENAPDWKYYNYEITNKITCEEIEKG